MSTKQIYKRVIAAMRDADVSQWTIARALVDEWNAPKGQTSLKKRDYAPLEAAQIEAGLTPWQYDKARQYRAVAAMFGATDVVSGVSFSAHRIASQAGSLSAAKNALNAVINNVPELDGSPDLSKVTVQTVEAYVRTLNKSGRNAGSQGGSKPRSGKVGNLSVHAVAILAAKVRNLSNFVTPLIKAGRLDELKTYHAVVQNWCDWLGEAITKAEQAASQPANISKPATKPASKPATKAGTKAASPRGN